MLIGKTGLLGACALMALTGAAQTALAAEAGSVALEELIITANKREQNLQLTPLSVTALTSADLEKRHISAAADLQRVVPGLVLAEEVGVTPHVTIRGVGAANSFPGGDPGVPIHLDGHYLQASRFITRDMLDVERVEVLRGPQGTLYGRNASGGSINIISKQPTDRPEGSLALGVGNYGDLTATAVLSGPLSERLRGRLAATHDQHDGYVENLSPAAPRRDLLRANAFSARGALEYDLTPDLQARLSAYGSQDTGDSFVYRIIGDLVKIGGPTFASLPASYVNPTNSDPFKVRQDSPNTTYDKASGIAFDVDWNLGVLKFKSLSAYNHSASGYRIDLDATDATPKVTYGTDVKYDTYSQELQALYDGGKVKALGGLFAYKETSVFSRDFQAPPGVYGIDYAYSYNPPPRLSGESYGVFANLDYSASDRLTVTLGGRYSYDMKSMRRGYQVDINGAPVVAVTTDMHDSWKKFTWRAALNYRLSDDVSAYATISTGYKSGGYNAISVAEVSYRPETVTAYELGLKSQWWEDRLRVNVAAFVNKYSDKQEFVLQLGAGASAETAIRNAASATMSGVEVEYLAKLTPGLRLDGTASWLDAEYDSFASIDTTRPSLGLIDLKGHKLPYAPNWKWNIGLQQDWSFGLGELSARLDYAWMSSYFSDAFNRAYGPLDNHESDRSPAHGVASASLTWSAPTRDWSARAWIRNIADDRSQTYIQPSYHNAHATQYEAPRSYGVSLQRRF